jgi:hypothetical protein
VIQFTFLELYNYIFMKEKLQHQILVIVDMSLYKKFRRKMLTNNDKFASVVIRKLMRQYIDS